MKVKKIEIVPNYQFFDSQFLIFRVHLFFGGHIRYFSLNRFLTWSYVRQGLLMVCNHRQVI